MEMIYSPTGFAIVGGVQLSILIASALVPMHLDWKQSLANLPALLRQLFWVYGGYVVLGIVSLGVINLVAANDLSQGGTLARCFCVYAAGFWGIRLSLQAWLDVKPHLTHPLLKIGYHLLTVAFAGLTLFFGFAVFTI